MMKTITFHVGAAKTASTSIQLALSKHSRYLYRQGFYFPVTTRCKHPELSFYSSFDLLNAYAVYVNYLPKDYDHSSNLLEYFRCSSTTYIDEFLSSDCHTLILTDEILPYYCNTIDKLVRLRSLFPDFLKVHFIYYTRSPSDMYISLYSTLVKVNQTNVWPHQFRIPTTMDDSTKWIASPEMFDHNTFISNIKSVFGTSSISVFSYQSILKSEEYPSPVHHFFSFLGIDKIDLANERVSNPRLDYLSLFVLSFANHISRFLSGNRILYACHVALVRTCLTPLLEYISLIGMFRFPSQRVLRNRSSFDRLFL